MNCSKARRLPALLGAVLRKLRRAGNTRTAPPGPGPGADGLLYILLSMIFYGCLAGALILTYTRSQKLESKHDCPPVGVGTGAPSAPHRRRRRAARPRGSAHESGGTGGQSSAI